MDGARRGRGCRARRSAWRWSPSPATPRTSLKTASGAGPVGAGLRSQLRPPHSKGKRRRAEQSGDPRRLDSSPGMARLGMDLRSQYDLERGAAPGGAADAEAALDRRRSVAHVPQPVPRGTEIGREAFAVVLDRD